MSKVWVTRDKDENSDYEMWWERPTRNRATWDVKDYEEGSWPHIGEFCVEHFERLTGIKLAPGEILECTLSLTPNLPEVIEPSRVYRCEDE